MRKGISKTNRPHTLAWYAERLGLPIYCVENYHNRGYPLENPKELLRLILLQQRQPPNLDRLQELAYGEGAAPEQNLLPLWNENGDKDDENGVNEPNGHEPNGNGHRRELPAIDANDSRTPLRRQLDWLEAEVERARDDYLQEERPADRFHKSRTLHGLIAAHHKLSRGLANAEMEAGNSLKKSECEATWARVVGRFRAELEALPARVALHPMFRKIDSGAVEELLRTETDQLLRVFGKDPLSSIK